MYESSMSIGFRTFRIRHVTLHAHLDTVQATVSLLVDFIHYKDRHLNEKNKADRVSCPCT